MKRSAGKKGSKGSKRKGQTSKKPVDLRSLRQQIDNLVGNEAVEMVASTIAEVKKGHYAALKYLFEMIGLYPASAAQATAEDETVTKALFKRLDLPLEPLLDGTAKEGVKAAGGSDAVE